MLFCLAFLSSLSAQVLYDDGPINGTVNAWTINFGYLISDSITFAQTATVGGFDLGVWEYPGDQTLTVDWSITAQPYSGNIYGQGTASVTDTFISVNQYGYDIDKLSAAISGPTLNAGTYWLNIQNAVSKLGDPVFWDENSGVGCTGDNGMGGGCPSEACGGTCIDGQAGIPPESFDILGTASGQTPEPGSFVLFGSGILGVAGIVGRVVGR